MLQVRDNKTGKVAIYDDLLDFLQDFSYYDHSLNSDTLSVSEVESESKGGEVLVTLINEVGSAHESIKTFDIHIISEDSSGINPDPDSLELDESYLLLRLSEEDVTQVLYFYGLEDLEVSIEGDPTVTLVDGYELSDLTGGCHVEIRGWLSYTKGWHGKQEELIRAAVSQSIQDIAHAKKGRVNHFAFL